MRALRPLRLVQRVPAIAKTVQGMYNALSGVATVSLVALFYMLIFAILGVQLFAGKFAQCSLGPTHAASATLTHGAPR